MRIVRLWLPAVATVWPVCAFARDNEGARMNDGDMDRYGQMMNYWGGGLVMWLLLFAATVALVYLLVKASGAGATGQPSRETPLDILKKRYARGEITKEQFDEIKKDL
jgi:uncharacterized membrane protein